MLCRGRMVDAPEFVEIARPDDNQIVGGIVFEMGEAGPGTWVTGPGEIQGNAPPSRFGVAMRGQIWIAVLHRMIPSAPAPDDLA